MFEVRLGERHADGPKKPEMSFLIPGLLLLCLLLSLLLAEVAPSFSALRYFGCNLSGFVLLVG